ncbi:MAG: TonB family protein [Pontiellaceae bacterium]|nr:TonB family protein [Pontiellaceae bacterium]
MRNLKSIIFRPILLGLLLSVGVHAIVLNRQNNSESAQPRIKKSRTVVQLSLQQPKPTPAAVEPQPEPLPEPTPEPAPPVIVPTPEPEPEIVLPEPVPRPLLPVAPHPPEESASPPEIAESAENGIAAPKKSGDTTAARLLEEFKPDYPAFSKRKNEEGRVQLLLQILADGSVGSVEILSSSGSSRLDNAAQKAAKKCPYAPARDENDRPVESTANLSYTFTLKNE